LALRLVFMGTPDFAVPALEKIANSRHQIVAVYTRAPKPGGRRGLELTPTPIGVTAEHIGIQVFTPKSLKGDEAVAEMYAHHADVAVVVAYGLILPKPILDAFPLGCFNLHASLLPRWRGAAPIHRAVMAGDPKTGVMVMKMNEGLDTGPIVRRQSVRIEPDETTGDLHDRLARIGPNLMIRALDTREKRRAGWKRQSPTDVIYANKITKSETRIDWAKSWNEVHNHCRGLSPFPGAWCEFADVGRVKILRTTEGTGGGPPGRVLDDKLTIACGTGAVQLVELQREGRKPMFTDEFLRGTQVAPGTVLH
jgi:methionyl-tRNA formyltransferase